MQCPKCGQQNADTVRFCTKCHTPLRFECPACKHVQAQGGKCEKCGVDFAKYGAMLIFQAEQKSKKEHERVRRCSSFLKQILLLPITGGLSLLHYLFRGGRDD